MKTPWVSLVIRKKGRVLIWKFEQKNLGLSLMLQNVTPPMVKTTF
jgi:hypothetical protein